MQDSLITGGSAYPHERMKDMLTDANIPESTGMTKRERYAIAALPAIIDKCWHKKKGVNAMYVAAIAFNVADRMVRESRIDRSE